MKPVTPLISFVMPFYRRIDLFRKALILNGRSFFDTRAELILALDEPSEEKEVVAEMLKHDIRGRVIVNDTEHDWRPPCKAINVGLRHARADIVAIVSPETIISTHLDRLLTIGNRYDDCFYGGILTHVDIGNMQDALAMGKSATLGYGFLMCHKNRLESIHGFDERRQLYGGDDNDIRVRLEKSGVKPVVEDFWLMHIEHGNVPRRDIRDGQYEPWGQDIIIPGQENWGRDFSRIAYEN